MLFTNLERLLRLDERDRRGLSFAGLRERGLLMSIEFSTATDEGNAWKYLHFESMSARLSGESERDENARSGAVQELTSASLSLSLL